LFFFTIVLMNSKELTITWVGALLGTGLTDINVLLSTLTYLSTLTFTGIKIYQHIKNKDNGNTGTE